jgi:hypothetical protein
VKTYAIDVTGQHHLDSFEHVLYLLVEGVDPLRLQESGVRSDLEGLPAGGDLASSHIHNILYNETGEKTKNGRFRVFCLPGVDSHVERWIHT